jgi:hypothetical protein
MVVEAGGAKGPRKGKARCFTLAVLLLVLVGPVTISGCGDGDDRDEAAADAIATVLDEVWAAVDDGDLDAICERMGKAGIQQVRTIGHTTMPSCQAGLRQLVSGARAVGAHDERPGPEILELDLADATATARVRVDQRETEIPLVVEDGRWKIDALFGPETAGGLQ